MMMMWCGDVFFIYCVHFIWSWTAVVVALADQFRADNWCCCCCWWCLVLLLMVSYSDLVFEFGFELFATKHLYEAAHSSGIADGPQHSVTLSNLWYIFLYCCCCCRCHKYWISQIVFVGLIQIVVFSSLWDILRVSLWFFSGKNQNVVALFFSQIPFKFFPQKIVFLREFYFLTSY